MNLKNVIHSVFADEARPTLTPPQQAAGGHLGYLDGWRGIAILMVLFGHFIQPFPIRGINLATLGVDFFFVLSGRLMGEILFIKRAALPVFFMRRFSRVYPGLLAFVVLAALLFCFTVHHAEMWAVLSALTFTLNYAMIYYHHTVIFDHIWSLCVEEHSYFILGALAYIERRTNGRAQILILVIGIGALINGLIQSAVFNRDFYDVYWRTDVQCAPIFLAAWFFLFSRQIDRKRMTWCVPAFVALALFFKSMLFEPAISYSLGTFFLALAICFLDASPDFMKRALSLAPLRQIGIWSYSLYLWQQPFFMYKWTVSRYWLVPAALVCGLLSFYFVEKPIRTYLNARIERRIASES